MTNFKQRAWKGTIEERDEIVAIAVCLWQMEQVSPDDKRAMIEAFEEGGVSVDDARKMVASYEAMIGLPG